mmetsp:Transcript_4422/g.9963  ORF Transcript_4422/g.9963 Transcript_4422/m.9963 type:complete len:215 (-) Transcript_4422:961-1605(-)
MAPIPIRPLRLFRRPHPALEGRAIIAYLAIPSGMQALVVRRVIRSRVRPVGRGLGATRKCRGMRVTVLRSTHIPRRSTNKVTRHAVLVVECCPILHRRVGLLNIISHMDILIAQRSLGPRVEVRAARANPTYLLRRCPHNSGIASQMTLRELPTLSDKMSNPTSVEISERIRPVLIPMGNVAWPSLWEDCVARYREEVSCLLRPTELLARKILR